MNVCTVPKDKDESISGENVQDNGNAFGNTMCHTAFVRSTGVIEDENEGESDEEEDEGPPPLLYDPEGDSDDEDDDEDDDEESVVNNNKYNEIAVVTDDVVAIETLK